MKLIQAVKKLKYRRPILLAASTVGVVVLVGCLALTVQSPRAARSTGAVLVLADNVHDLGPRTTRQEWRVPFQIQNSGTRRLVVNEVDAGCRCGNPIRKTLIIPPGESAQVIVTLDTRFATGSIEKIASFTSSDPIRPRFDLTVRGQMDREKPVPPDPDGKQVSVLVRQ